ncbi:MAG TPA: hypothetical protein VF719_05105, partial [Abditibacteriaceae bacterium]
MQNLLQTHGETGCQPSLFPATLPVEKELSTVAHGLSQNTKKPTSSRARLKFSEGSEVAPPAGFSNRETWTATVWLNNLANGGARVGGRLIDLPQSDAAEIRRWFHHRWQGVQHGLEPQWVQGALAGIGSLWRIDWNEVAAHYKRCPWADLIQEAFGNMHEAGLDIARTPEATF